MEQVSIRWKVEVPKMRRTTPNVSHVIPEYVAMLSRRSRSPQMERTARSVLRRFTASCGDLQIGSLRPEHVERFYYGPHGLANHCSGQTLAAYRNVLKQFFAWCNRRDWLRVEAALMLAGVAERDTMNDRNRYRMSRVEIMRVIDAANHPRDRALIAFVANTLSRISEAKEIGVNDLSLDKGELYITIVKTKKRVVKPITSDLDRELRAWLTFYTNEVGPLKPEYRLFPAFKANKFKTGGVNTPKRELNPTARITAERTIIRAIADKAGVELEPGDGWHTIRRSTARILFDLYSDYGYDTALRMVQASLNHKQSSTTERYLGLEVEAVRVSRILKGKSFLTVASDASVVPFGSAMEVATDG